MTVGSLGFDGFSFMDDLMHASKRQWLMAFGAGVVFNLGNMLMMAAAAVAGLSVALPFGLGVSLMIGVGRGWSCTTPRQIRLLLFVRRGVPADCGGDHRSGVRLPDLGRVRTNLSGKGRSLQPRPWPVTRRH